MKKVFIGLGVIAVGCAVFMIVNQQTVRAASGDDAKVEDAKDKQADKQDDKKDEKKIIYNVTAAEVSPRKMELFVESTATLRPDRSIQIFSKVAGQVNGLHVEEGDAVEKGAVLIELDGGDAKLELQQAMVNMQKAKLEYERVKESFKKDLVAAEDHDRLKFDYESAQASVNLAQYRVSLTEIQAPFAGTVTARNVELGQTIQPSEQLLTLASLNPLEADVFLPERKAARLRVGQRVSMARDDHFESTFAGSVARIAPIVDSETGTVKVTIAVENVPSEVRPGMYVHLRVVTDTVDSTAAIPKRAVVFDSRQNASVFVIENGEGDGVRLVRRVEIALGVEESGFVSVDEGLEKGQVIVLTGKEALKDGALVNET